MLCVPTNPAYRRYLRRFLPASGLYVGSIVLASALIPRHAHASATTVAIALLPGLAVVGMIWAIGRMLIELDDEYLRLLEIRKALIATAVVLSVASVWGLLEIYTDVPHLPVFWMFPLCAFGLSVGAAWNKVSGA